MSWIAAGLLGFLLGSAIFEEAKEKERRPNYSCPTCGAPIYMAHMFSIYGPRSTVEYTCDCMKKKGAYNIVN